MHGENNTARRKQNNLWKTQLPFGSFNQLNFNNHATPGVITLNCSEYNNALCYVGEILDDGDKTDSANCRYNACVTLKKTDNTPDNSEFRKQIIDEGHYARFAHCKSHESAVQTYNSIFEHWTNNVNYEIADRPFMEIYWGDDTNSGTRSKPTEIYIPVVF